MNETKNDSASLPESETAPGDQPVRFRIVHLLYLLTVIASCLATFGTAGLVPAVVISVFWGSVFTSQSRPRAFVVALLVLSAVACLGMCCLVPAVRSAREAARRVQCANNLKNIALALQNYHDTYKTFPPAYLADENGEPMHSWRVLILPFIEQGPLYDRYDFSQPWDGPANRKLLASMPDVYACPSETRGTAAGKWKTSYVAVLGERTVWPGTKGRKMSEIIDGTSNTVLVVEAGGLEIPWLKPDDINRDDCVQLLASADLDEAAGHHSEDFFYVYDSGRNVAMADGSVQFLSRGLSPQILSDLMTIDDGNVRDDNDIDIPRTELRRPKLGNWFRLGLFFLIAIFPTPWVWLHPRRELVAEGR